MEGPQTRQLTVRFHGNLPQNERLLDNLFSKFGRLKYVRLMPRRDLAFITYWATADARKAKEKLSGHSFQGINIDITYSRTSRLLFLDNVPKHFTAEAVTQVLERNFARFGVIEHINILTEKRMAFILFQQERDAVQAVDALQEHREDTWRWEIEFHREQRPNQSGPNRQGGDAADGSRAPTAPSPGPASSASGNTAAQSQSAQSQSEQPEAGEAASLPPPPPAAASSAPVAAPSKAEGSPPAASRRSPSRRSPRSDGSGSDRDSDSRSRSPRSRSRSPHARSRSASPERRTNGSPAHSPRRSPSASPARDVRSPSPHSHKDRDDKGRRKRRDRSPSASPKRNVVPKRAACDGCAAYTVHLGSEHAVPAEAQIKKLISAWFRGSFERTSHKRDRMRRSAFLQEVNEFLERIGEPLWHTKSRLYRKWFEEKYSAYMDRSRHYWMVQRRASNAAFVRLLEELLDDAKKGPEHH